MLCIRYDSSVTYTDVFGDKNCKVYSIFARNDEDARSIVKEILFYAEGVSDINEIVVTPAKPAFGVENRITLSLINVLREVNKLLSGSTYKDFLELFIKFGGKNLKLGGKPSYLIDLLGFTLLIEMNNGTASINNSEIRYVDENGYKYVIRKGEVYYAS